MDLLCVATSEYQDPFATEWRPDLRYTVSFLRRRNIQAGFAYAPLLEPLGPVHRLLRERKPPCLLIDISEETYGVIAGFLRNCREAVPETRILASGIPPSLSTFEVLARHPEIDCVVAGERELTLLETVERLRRGAALRDVRGLQSRDFRSPPRPLLEDLDDLGEMIHDGLAEMLSVYDPADRVGYLIASRGCYGRCSFCGVPEFYRASPGKPWRGRSPGSVVAEIRGLVERFGIRHFVFQDDNFFGPGPAGQVRARDIAAGIARSGLQIQYSICCRLNDLREDTLEPLKASGLAGVGVSVESASQSSLDLFTKGIKVDRILATLALLERLRVRTEVNLIFFDPYLTVEGVRKNLALLDFLRGTAYVSYSDSFPLNELKPFPWSPVFRRLRSEGLLHDDGSACRFRDPHVAKLAAFVRRIKARVPLTFKKRLLFDEIGAPRGLAGRSVAATALVAAGVRQWLGLAVFPQALVEACDAMEQDPNSADDEFRRIEERVMERLQVLQPLKAAMQRAICSSRKPDLHEQTSGER